MTRTYLVGFALLSPPYEFLLADQAGAYVSLIVSSPMGSVATRRSGGRGPEKKGVP